ncbi:hypothetical protein K466DRAFT_497099, partial [Polyporus arcularius HHB13444]
VMHPKYKVQYFVSQKWPQGWIDTAKDILREEWKRYKPAPAPTTAATESQADDIFAAALDNASTAVESDALEDYLNSPVLASINDSIKYWHILDDGHTPLARMALDIMSAPAASVDVERARGGLTVSKLRHNLSDESTRAATVLSTWTKIPGLVPHKEIVQLFDNKGKRMKAKARSGEAQQDESDSDDDVVLVS